MCKQRLFVSSDCKYEEETIILMEVCVKIQPEISNKQREIPEVLEKHELGRKV